VIFACASFLPRSLAWEFASRDIPYALSSSCPADLPNGLKPSGCSAHGTALYQTWHLGMDIMGLRPGTESFIHPREG